MDEPFETCCNVIFSGRDDVEGEHESCCPHLIAARESEAGSVERTSASAPLASDSSSTSTFRIVGKGVSSPSPVSRAS